MFCNGCTRGGIGTHLIDSITNEINSLPGVESSYLQKLGLGGYNNSNDLLEAISKWKGMAA